MIGQKNVLNQINKLVEQGFPRFVIITGQKGQGKTTLAHEIAKKLHTLIIDIGIKVDEIRDMIEMAYKQTEPIIYLIQNADKMSIGARNSLLKVIEEPPNNAYFIMELQQIENTLETIKSRCQEIRMDQYSEVELTEFINQYYTPEIPSVDKALLLKACNNKYQIDKIVSYNVAEFYNYVDKVFNNIYKVQSANSFKISEQIDLKDTGEGYDVELFWNMYIARCFTEMWHSTGVATDDWAKSIVLSSCIDITEYYKTKLSITGINKQSLFDMWLLDIRKEYRK